MNASLMLRDFADAVERHDGSRFAKLFAADGVYHDVFYGTFEARAKIATMIDDWFYRTARDFRFFDLDSLERRSNCRCPANRQATRWSRTGADDAVVRFFQSDQRRCRSHRPLSEDAAPGAQRGAGAVRSE
jgi:hypothetical protein